MSTEAIHTATASAETRGRKWPIVVGFFVVAFAVAVIAYALYRHNDAAALAVVISLFAIVLLSTFPRVPWAIVHRKTSRLVLRICFCLGAILGIIVIVWSSNSGVRIAAVVLLCGIHMVAVATSLTILVQFLPNRARLTRLRLCLWLVVAVGAIFLCVKADVKPTCGEAVDCKSGRGFEVLGIGPAAYLFWVLATSVVAAGLSLLYLNPWLPRARTPTLYGFLGFAGLALGATMLVGTVAATAWWRNNDPVVGPPLYNLREIPAIDGEYVALGDSYSAGEGLQPFNAFTESDTAHLGNGCHRSNEAYSQLLRFEGPTPAQRFVACSGAVASDVFNQFTVSDKEGNSIVVPPQVAPGEHPEVGLVTITIGGNDVVFSSVVTHCFLRTDCIATDFEPPDANPARGIMPPAAAPLGEWARAAIGQVKAKMDVLYPKLEHDFPNARVVVIGYPYLFPDRPPPFWNLTDCQTILRRFTEGERNAVRDLQDDLNQVLHDSAAAANIEFISPAAGWKDHEPCGHSEEQYTNSIKPFIISSTAGFTPGDGGTFHPNKAGQRELARQLTCYLVAHPDEVDLTAGDDPIGSLTNPIPDCTKTG